MCRLMWDFDVCLGDMGPFLVLHTKQWADHYGKHYTNGIRPDQGPVVQSVVSLMSSFRVKMLTVLVSAISNSRVFLLKKSECKCKSYSQFFSKNISIYAIFNDQSFNDMLTNHVSFEQLGPDCYSVQSHHTSAMNHLTQSIMFAYCVGEQ